jgi:bifunctional non-homologous end joining protein LigD
MARWIPPMLATLAGQPSSPPGWVYETKLDGIRCLAEKRGREVVMLSRNQLSLNERFPQIADALREQSGDFMIDGEIVVFSGKITSFQALQQRSGSAWLYAFDLLRLGARDVRGLTLRERKALLKDALEYRKPLRYSEAREGDGIELYREACAAGLEGLIAKDASAPYISGRSKAWLKFKCVNAQEVVIGGYTDPEGSRVGFGALLVGYYEGGDLKYAGKVGTGYDVETLLKMSKQLKSLEQASSPFDGPVPGVRSAHWVRPKLVAQVGFTEWTSAGRLRHPRFEGIRVDKKATDVVRERPRA